MKILITDYKERTAYDGNSIYNTGTGGATTCVIYLSKELSNMGHEVTVSNRREKTKIVDNVFYKSISEVSKENYDIWINSRTPELFSDGCINAKMKIFWNHDLYSKDLAKYHKDYNWLICVSEWHLNWVDSKYNWRGKVPGKYIYNGTDLSKFSTNKITKYPETNFNIWTPVSKKGLDVFLGMWDELNEKITLRTGKKLITDIYGDYLMWGYTINENNSVSKGIYLDLYNNKYKNIRYHGNTDQIKLAKAYLKSDIFIYSSDFKETFGINSLDAMASGTPQIYCKYGALPEIVGDAGICIDIKMRDDLKNVREEFKNAVIENSINLLTDKKLYNKLKDNGLKRAKQFDWYKIAKKWENLF
jgi:glycosyltransferase involved in cell wall biosynthesis